MELNEAFNYISINYNVPGEEADESLFNHKIPETGCFCTIACTVENECTCLINGDNYANGRQFRDAFFQYARKALRGRTKIK